MDDRNWTIEIGRQNGRQIGRRETDDKMADRKWTTESVRQNGRQTMGDRKWPTQTNWKKMRASGGVNREDWLGASKNVFKRFYDASVFGKKRLKTFFLNSQKNVFKRLKTKKKINAGVLCKILGKSLGKCRLHVSLHAT